MATAQGERVAYAYTDGMPYALNDRWWLLSMASPTVRLGGPYGCSQRYNWKR
jgi:hypothetical protein